MKVLYAELKFFEITSDYYARKKCSFHEADNDETRITHFFLIFQEKHRKKSKDFKVTHLAPM